MKTTFNPSNWIDSDRSLTINESDLSATIENSVSFRLVNHRSEKDDDLVYESYEIELKDGKEYKPTDWKLEYFSWKGEKTRWVAKNWNGEFTRDHENKFIAVAQLICNLY